MKTVHSISNPPLEEVIQHYGVKGMRWGVRRSQEELDRAAGRIPAKTKKTGNATVDSVIDKTSKNNTKVGAIPAPVILFGAAMALRVVNVIRFERDKGKRFAKETGDREFKKNESLAEKKTVAQLEKDVVQQINPGFPANGTKANCRRATMAYEMRRRGNDVKATESKFAAGQDAKGFESAVNVKHKQSIWGENRISDPKTIINGTSIQTGNEILKALGSEPDGSRGELSMAWMFGGGHSVAYEIVDNKPVIFDTQSNKTYNNAEDLKEFSVIMADAAFTRLDNKTIDPEFIKRWVTDV